ncbi:MAG TPA: serine hydrolase domain-containing protein [Longimicrobium sp.]|nr:serine hydrolase domain-containing protein [Longimicrobium sp.]
MIKRILAGLLGAAALGSSLAACGTASATLAAGGDCAAVLAPATREVDSAAARRGLPGGFVLVLKGDQVVCSHHFGSERTATRVPIASASKWLTAVAVLTLVDEGKLSLDEPISVKLPEFQGAAGQITLRQLLSHTSGIASSQLCLLDRGTSLASCTTEIAATPLNYAPGEAFSYGSSSFQVAGRLAEIAAGESWNRLFKHRVADPLGIPSTSFSGSNPLLAGGGSSTGDEYARVLRMIATRGSHGGRRILSDTAIAAMARDYVGNAPLAFTPRNDAHGYGLGAWRDAVDASGAATQLSSPGSSGFYPWVDFKRDIVGIVWFPAIGADDGAWFALTQFIQANVRQAHDAGQL